MRLGDNGDAWTSTASDFDPSNVVSEEDSPQSIPQDDPITQFLTSLRFYHGDYPIPGGFIGTAGPQYVQPPSAFPWTLLLIVGGFAALMIATKR